jgi:urease subunit alpha
VTFAAGSAASALERTSVAGRAIVPIGRTRGLTRADLWLNRAAAPVEIDPADGRVTLDGELLAVDPVDEVPLSRRYFFR